MRYNFILSKGGLIQCITGLHHDIKFLLSGLIQKYRRTPKRFQWNPIYEIIIHACQSGYRTRYVRLPDLFSEIEVARIQGKYKELMKQYQKYALMILDEFLLLPTSESEQRDLLELMEARCGKSSTILCSQFIPEGWHDRLGGSALADSILDRIIPSAYTMIIDGDVSMRKRKRLIQD